MPDIYNICRYEKQMVHIRISGFFFTVKSVLVQEMETVRVVEVISNWKGYGSLLQKHIRYSWISNLIYW